MLLCLNINLFSDENREFINVLPIKKQNIYLLRALSTLAVAIILDIIIAVIVLYFFRYNQYIQLAVMSKISKIDFNWINDFYGIKRFAADFVHRSLLIVAGAGFLSFLNTIFSKPRLVFILGFISFFVTLAGFKGIAIFADYFSLFNKNAFYTFCSDIENYSLSPISLILLTIFFTIAGAFLYKKEKNENRQGFFMFYPLRYLCYALGSFFGGFSFFAMINLKILSHIPKINMLTSIIIVIFGAFMAFFIIKKLIDTLE